MQGQPSGFWAKLRSNPEAKCVEWHPLADHCVDVAAVAEQLLALPIWRARLGQLAGRPLDEVTCSRLAVLVTLHDVGKLNIGFQAKGRPELGPTAEHVKPALGALLHRPGPFSCLDELASWGDATTDLLVAAICHHGYPYNFNADGQHWQAAWWTPRGNLDPREQAENLLAGCKAWFPLAFMTDAPTLPDSAPFSHAFAGLVMLADWIGSDTRFFPFSEAGDPDRVVIARSRAKQVIVDLGLDVPAESRASEEADPFVRIAPAAYVARPSQTAMAALPRDQRASITILEAETGSGKTEAVLARFVSMFDAGLVDGLYFALPTRSAATQMHRRVCDAIRQAFMFPPPVVLAVPGYLRVDDSEGRRLPPFEVLWPEDQERFRYRGWAAEHPKRYLAGCIVVGTIDQVLLSALMVGHAHLRATALLRHLLVVDEVHASDAYMTRILESVLARHAAAGGHAVLLSATLAAEARARLLRPGTRIELPGRQEAERVPYPLITHRGDAESAFQVCGAGADRSVELQIRPWLENPEKLAAAACAAAVQGAKVVVIRNTVADCIRTQLALERVVTGQQQGPILFTCAGVPAPHHALFARPDREALDNALEAHIGKNRAVGGCVVVATQTVQQSLDLDADVLFSDLCPIDVLLQRIGRLHRHERSRPPRFERATAFVVVPARRDLGLLLGDNGVSRNHHGLGRVYPDLRILEATWRLIERDPVFRLPSMCRRLVEDGVHSGALSEIVSHGGPRWQAHANQIVGTERGHERQAELNIVDWSRSYAETSFPRLAHERILTRLGEGDRRVRFLQPVVGPFGLRSDELVLRARWAAGVPSDVEFADAITATAGVIRFRLGQGFFVYDRLGLRPERPSESIEG